MLCNILTYSILLCCEVVLFQRYMFCSFNMRSFLAKTGLVLIGWAWKNVAMKPDKASQALFSRG